MIDWHEHTIHMYCTYLVHVLQVLTDTNIVHIIHVCSIDVELICSILQYHKYILLSSPFNNPIITYVVYYQFSIGKKVTTL